MRLNLEWSALAACRDHDPNLFFPDMGEKYSNEARDLCWRCPVRKACLDYAMDCERGLSHTDRAGMWGGLTPRDRADLSKCSRRRVA